jgi:hypothetical protein
VYLTIVKPPKEFSRTFLLGGEGVFPHSTTLPSYTACQRPSPYAVGRVKDWGRVKGQEKGRVGEVEENRWEFLARLYYNIQARLTIHFYCFFRLPKHLTGCLCNDNETSVQVIWRRMWREENCLLGSSTVCIIRHMHFGYQNHGDEMGGACMNGRLKDF